MNSRSNYNTTVAPICLFVYNRLVETKQTIESLQKNHLAEKSDLIIFSDGSRNDEDSIKINEVRKYLHKITGFKSILIIESNQNKGLANSIISGVSQILKKFGKVIVIEDDLILSHNFLSFMNAALAFYSKNKLVFSISGFSVMMKTPKNYPFDIYFWGRSHSWGWATWDDRWSTIDWEIEDYNSFISNKRIQNSFNKFGSDLSRMLISYKRKKIDSWWIRFTYNQFKQGKLTVYPIVSKVINNGFVTDATHCKSYNRFIVEFDKTSKNHFKLINNIHINNKIVEQVYKYYSLKTRIYFKFLTYLLKLGMIKQRKQFF